MAQEALSKAFPWSQVEESSTTTLPDLFEVRKLILKPLIVYVCGFNNCASLSSEVKARLFPS